MEDLSFKNRLQVYGHNLSKSDGKIAEFILAKPDFAASANIVDLAMAIGTSNSTITRFCQKLQYRNYGEFQALLLSRGVHKAVPSQTIEKIAHYYQSIINSSIELTDEDALSLFIAKIQKANRVLTCGLGSSGLTAKELSIRLNRMGKNAMAITDSHMMLAQASLFTKDDLIVAISNSGKTIEVINTCKYAKEHSVPVCLLTQYSSAETNNIADIILFSSSVNQIDDYHYVNSQLPLMFLIDAVTYGLLEDEKNQENYQKTLKVLSLDKKSS